MKAIMRVIMNRVTISIFFTFLFFGISFAQDDSVIKGGTIKYESFDKFDLSYFKDADPGVMDWLASMPKGAKSAKVLYFKNNYSLFREDNSVQGTVVDEKVLVMRSKMPYITPPSPELKIVYRDIDKGIETRQMELMTRFFIVEQGIMEWDWKPGTKQARILDYLCMSATAASGDKTVTAWFSPQIQTETGPGLYCGLPGLILAVDIDGENVLLATEVDLSQPEDNVFMIPSEGRKMKIEAFRKLVDEKMDQYRTEQENQKKVGNNDKSGYHNKY